MSSFNCFLTKGQLGSFSFLYGRALILNVTLRSQVPRKVIRDCFLNSFRKKFMVDATISSLCLAEFWPTCVVELTISLFTWNSFFLMVIDRHSREHVTREMLGIKSFPSYFVQYYKCVCSLISLYTEIEKRINSGYSVFSL